MKVKSISASCAEPHERVSFTRQKRHCAESISPIGLHCVPLRLNLSDCVRRPVEDAVLRNLQLETLREAVDNLGDQGRDLVELRYGRGLTMEEIGTIYGVSMAAVSLDGSWRLCRLEPSRPPCGESG